MIATNWIVTPKINDFHSGIGKANNQNKIKIAKTKALYDPYKRNTTFFRSIFIPPQFFYFHVIVSNYQQGISS